MLEVKTIEQKLQSSLLIDRFIHTMGVRDEGIMLARKYGDEKLVSKSEIACLLHDCTKDYPLELKKRFCKEYPDLIHPFLGAEVARREYEVCDEDILSAIKYHTTGRPDMSLLEKIVFVADYIEPNRNPFDGLIEARELAYVDIDRAMEFILERTIEYVNQRKRPLHPLSVKAYEYYKR